MAAPRTLQSLPRNSAGISKTAQTLHPDEIRRRLDLWRAFLAAGLAGIGAGSLAAVLPRLGTSLRGYETPLPEHLSAVPAKVPAATSRTLSKDDTDDAEPETEKRPGLPKYAQVTAQQPQYNWLDRLLMPFAMVTPTMGTSDPRLSAPGMTGLAASLGIGALGSWALADALIRRRRQQLREAAIEEAQREYYDALRARFLNGEKQAQFGDLDALYDLYHSPEGHEKRAILQTLTDTTNLFVGSGGAAGAISGLAAAVLAYRWRKARTRQKLLEKALKLRNQMRATMPQPVQVVPETSDVLAISE